MWVSEIFDSTFPGWQAIGLLYSKATIVLLVAALICVTLRRRSAAQRHLVCAACGCGLLMLLAGSWLLPRWSILPLAPAPDQASQIWIPPESVAGTDVSPTAELIQNDPEPTPTMAPTAIANVQEAGVPAAFDPAAKSLAPSHPAAAPRSDRTSWSMPLVFVVYVFVASMLLTRLAVARARLGRRCASSKRLTGGNLADRVALIANQMQLRRTVDVYEAGPQTTPMTWGWLYPKILVPRGWDAWDAESLQVVCRHEMVHIRRWDYVWQLLFQIVAAVYWAHPLVWVLAWRGRVECERACDDEVLRSGVKPSDYADRLVHLCSQWRRREAITAVSLAMASLPKRLEKRIVEILDQRVNRESVSRRRTIVSLMLSAMLSIPMAAATGQQRVVEETSSDAKGATNDEAIEAASSAPKSSEPEAIPFGMIDDLRGGSMALSPDGNQICVAGHDYSSSRLHLAKYPPARPADYRKIVDLTSVVGIPAIAWCQTDADRIAFLAKQSKKELPRDVRTREANERMKKQLEMSADDYEIVLYVISIKDGALRRVCSLDREPRGRQHVGSESIAWLTDGKMFVYLEGDILLIDFPEGWHDSDNHSQIRPRRVYRDQHVFGVFPQPNHRIATLERSQSDSETIHHLVLDHLGFAQNRSRINADYIPMLCYSGGDTYAMDEGQEIRVESIGRPELIMTLSNSFASWHHLPIAITPDDTELICQAKLFVTPQELADNKNRFDPQTTMIRNRADHVHPYALRDDKRTMAVSRLVRIPIQLRLKPVFKGPRIVSVSPMPTSEAVSPINELKIAFDRPMDPGSASFVFQEGGYRKRGPLTYDASKHEFSLPVVLQPNTQHHVTTTNAVSGGFRSEENEKPQSYQWSFRTSKFSSEGDAANSAKLVSVSPASGASINSIATVRLVFDRPMNPHAYSFSGRAKKDGVKAAPADPFAASDPFGAADPDSEDVPTAPLGATYDPSEYAFEFLLSLRRAKTFELEFTDFLTAEGVAAEPIRLTYRVEEDGFSQALQQRIERSRRDPELLGIVRAMLDRRREISSLESNQVLTSSSLMQPVWHQFLEMEEIVFRVQGANQFYADVTKHVDNAGFVLGSDGKNCWWLNDDSLTTADASKFDVKHVSIVDPLGATGGANADEVIAQHNLGYEGTVEVGGITCHRITSWVRNPRKNVGFARRRWLIDSNTSLPVNYEVTQERSVYRVKFTYTSVNQELEIAKFQPPRGENVKRLSLEPLQEGYDKRYLNAIDWSFGSARVGWGEFGPAGRTPGGLN